MKHSGLYRSSNQKFIKGVVSGLTHKIFFGAGFHIYFAYLLRMATLCFFPLTWLPYVLLVYFLKAKPTIDDGGDLNIEKLSWFEKFNNVESGSWKEKWIAWSYNGTPFDTSEYKKIRDNSGFFMKFLAGMSAASNGSKRSQARSAPPPANESSRANTSIDQANTNITQPSTSSSPVTTQALNSSSIYPLPYAESGAVITRFDPKTGYFEYKYKCDSCNKISSAPHTQRAEQGMAMGGGSYQCPYCKHVS